MSSNLAVAGEKGKGSAGFVMGFKKNTPGGNAGCTLAVFYPAWGIAHVGRIRRSAASASGAVQMPDATLVASYRPTGTHM